MLPLAEIDTVRKEMDNDFALGPIDLSIEPGTITALIGNNGSGKSTLLKLLMHLAKADSGTIKIAGKSVSGADESWKKKVAYQPQTIIGFNPYTGERLREMTSRWYPNWDEKLFRKMANLFDVPVNKRFDKLSQGSQQKLSLALTIARGAPLLILDEPTNFLDIPSKKALLDILIEWMEQEERAIIIASHQAEDIRKLADYLLIIRDGEMVGNFEKEALTSFYRRYWLPVLPEADPVPGEIFREGRSIISSQPEETEAYLQRGQIAWSSRTALELDEIIALLLQDTRGIKL
jgi:ABC-2 type transport system ATP-binding protein